MEKGWLIYFTLSFCLNAFARDLDWHETVTLAARNSHDVQAAQKEFESVRQLETGAHNGFFPRFAATLSQGQSSTENLFYTRTYGAQLTMSQNIFAGFGDIYRGRLASANTRAATASRRIQLATLSFELRQTYENLLYAQEYRKLAIEITGRRRENLRNVRLQFEGGRENKGSVLLSQAYVDQSELDEISARYQREIAEENLKRILVISLTEPLGVAGATAQEPPIAEKPPVFEEIALNHPDSVSAQAAELVAQNLYGAARSAFLPSLDFVASYGYDDPHFFPGRDRWSTGLTLTLPLFDGLRDYASYRANFYRLGARQLQAQSQLLKTIANLKLVYNDFLEAVQKQKVDESFRLAAEVRAQIARSKYKNGLMTFDDWDLVETDLIQRQKATLTSRRDRVIRRAQWEQAQGIGVFHE